MGIARLIWLAIGTVMVVWTGAAGASSLPLSPASLAAGAASVTRCDGNGVDFRYVLDGTASVTSVIVAGIDAACQGGTLRVTLTSTGVDVGTGSVQLPASGWTGTYAVSISPTPLSSSVTATHAAIEGP